MNKKLLYILLHFLSAVIADWTTIEHDFNMCGEVVPSEYAAIHVNDDGNTYSTSLLVRRIQTLKDEPTEATYNITMWGCTYDCNFNLVVKLNRVDGSVSVLTDNKEQNYVCGASKYTQNLIPIPKVTYTGPTPNEDHVFPPGLTAKYCSQGIHPDAPGWPIDSTDDVHSCIDRLLGRADGTYAASLQFGAGSSLPTDKIIEDVGVATYHMVDSANKAFNHWERHHRGFHDALHDLSIKMTPDNLKELAPPPPPEPKFNLLTNLIIPAVGLFIMCAIPIFLNSLAVEAAASVDFSVVSTEISEVAGEIAEADSIIAETEEGSIARIAATDYRDELISGDAAQLSSEIYDPYIAEATCSTTTCEITALETVSRVYNQLENKNLGQILAALRKGKGKIEKRGVRNKYERRGVRNKYGRRDTAVDNVGFFTANLVGAFFLPNVLSNVHDSLSTGGKSYPDLSSYLAGASENLLFHFNDTVYNNMFAANKSILTSFVKSQGVSFDQLIGSDDELYTNVRNRTYNHMSASIISVSLQSYNVVICDPKPYFCGLPCDTGHVVCPTIGTDNCVIAATPGQISELQSLRDTSDICSTDKRTGWNITHNANCDISLFKCQ